MHLRLVNSTEEHDPGRSATEWKTRPNKWLTEIGLVLILVSGYIFGVLHHRKFVANRIDFLEAKMSVCDSAVLRCEKQREDDREAYFRECAK